MSAEWGAVRHVVVLQRVPTPHGLPVMLPQGAHPSHASGAPAGPKLDRPPNLSSDDNELDVLQHMGTQMGRIAHWLKEQMSAMQSRIWKLETAKARFDAAEERRRKDTSLEEMEQYMPPRTLQGLLPTALLESYDFYEDCSQVSNERQTSRRSLVYSPDTSSCELDTALRRAAAIKFLKFCLPIGLSSTNLLPHYLNHHFSHLSL